MIHIPLFGFPNLHISMAFTLVSQLSGRSQKCVIEVKILRMWTSVNPKANNNLLSYDFLAIDCEKSTIQCVIKPYDMPAFESLLAENQVYIISNFFVNDRKRFYNVVPNPFCLNFLRTTKVVKSKTPPSKFPDYHYSFVKLEDLENRIRNNTVLSDVMGCVVSIGNVAKMFIGENSQEVFRRNLEIRIPDNGIVGVTLWGDFAQQLNEEQFVGAHQSTVIVFAAMTVSKYMGKSFSFSNNLAFMLLMSYSTPHSGKLTITTCSASKIIEDPQIPPAVEFKKSLEGNNIKVSLLQLGGGTQASSEEEKAKSRLDIQQLLALDPSESMGRKFTCEATILEIDISHGWFYNSCSECNKTIIPCDGKFWCSEHNERVPIPRCKIPFTVEDETGITQFMFFGNPEKRLVNGTMMSLIALANSNPMILPQPLKNLENQKRIFEIYMSKQSLGQARAGPQFIIQSTCQVSNLVAVGEKAQLQIEYTPSGSEDMLKEVSIAAFPESPTQSKFHLDLFDEESPVKKQKKKETSNKGQDPYAA